MRTYDNKQLQDFVSTNGVFISTGLFRTIWWVRTGKGNYIILDHRTKQVSIKRAA
jgi:hypothetical protein